MESTRRLPPCRVTTSEPRPGTCPRCGTPVTQAFKFCPACAYRLHSDPLPPPQTPTANGRWLRALVFLTFALLVVAMVATGFVVFAPAPPRTPPTPGVDTPIGLEGPLRVDEGLLREMVPLERRPVWYGTATLADGRSVVAEVRIDGYMRILRYEVTRGMYAQYLRDCQENPPRVPMLLRRLWNPPPLPPPPHLREIPEDATPEARRAIQIANEEAERPYRIARAYRQHGEAYVDWWWTRLAEHQKEQEGRLLHRPRSLKYPPSEAWQQRLLVPPTWIKPSVHEDYDEWDMPPAKGGVSDETSENYPVTDVSWFDAEAFAAWATEHLELPPDEAFRLPTWTEWMRTGHGGELTYKYPWGSEALIYACNNLNFWNGSEQASSLRAVDYRYSDGNFGQTPEHLWGMAGNAREWTRGDNWAAVGGNPEKGVAPDYLRVEAYTMDDELLILEAPTMGGSFEESIGDCTIDADSRIYRPKAWRGPAVGFRLRLPGYGAFNPLLK